MWKFTFYLVVSGNAVVTVSLDMNQLSLAMIVIAFTVQYQDPYLEQNLTGLC